MMVGGQRAVQRDLSEEHSVVGAGLPAIVLEQGGPCGHRFSSRIGSD